MTSPGYPYSASTPCDFFLAVNQGLRVKVEITLEANKCCDYLTVYDAYQGGNLIANLTGEITDATYTLNTTYARVSWIPQGGVHVKGMAVRNE
ncbi:hypothetical protein PRIPAC_86569 [Pristionchus pacificus]|uniref:CUB domain-containing protein n=1 Tax=Pristionchus pacificus TaxID=54126 RepID=A0A2A6BRX5_PRIPA|nr:hypothetical protein PRIPAC_86569 [Pristionchus pacificus]|eukprot:PDM68628.1 hypothetical protein PRIPAC_46930 [Pristionchus pacificus]